MAKIYKRTFIILLLMFFCNTAVMLAQQKPKEIKIECKNERLSTVFKKLEKLSGYKILFTYDDINQYVVTGTYTGNVTVVLKAIIGTKPLDVSVEGQYITIVLREKAAKLSRTFDSGRATVAFKGKVVDSSNKPLPGVNIKVENAPNLSVTDADGNYSIAVPENVNIKLIYSFVGMKSYQLSVNSNTTGGQLATVMLEETSNSVNEVVVTGYQTLDKTRIAGAVSYINSKDIYVNGVNSLEQSIQGMLPGVVVTNSSGLTGVRQQTRVRGTSTLTGSQDPVWVVDEVIQEDPLPFNTQTLNSLGEITSDNFDYIRNYVGNSISWLNPNDIESVTVLKDASATAIYGVRAANGVIVIKTKRGKEGVPNISYSTGINYGERVNYSQLGMMNSKERVDVSREIFERGLTANWSNNSIGYAGAMTQYLNKEITYDQLNAKIAKLETTNTDWFKLLYRNPISHNHSVSLSGGTEKVRYSASMAYNNTEGTAIGNGATGFSGRIALDMTINPKLRISFNLNGSRNITTGFNVVNPYKYASTTNRSIAAYDDNGNPSFYRTSSTYLFNFENERDQSGSETKVLALNSNLNINYNLSKSIKLQSLFSAGSTTSNGDSYATERTEYIAKIRWYDYGTVTAIDDAYKGSRLPRGGEYNIDDNTSNRWSWRNTISFDKVINNVHALTAMLGVDVSSTTYNGFSTTQYGYLRDRGESFATVPLTYGATTTFSNTLYTTNFLRKITDRLTNGIGSYLTLNYAYDNRYVANLSVRADASNRFGKSTNENFNPVWAGGLRWNAAHEKWFKPNAWVSDLSLRGSLGYQRNMASNYSPNLIVKIPSGTTAAVTDINTGEDLLTISSLPYADLRWEKTISTNFGVDLSLIDNKVRMSVEAYKKTGTDMIVTLNVPEEYGVNTMSVNGGSMSNTGYELTVGFTPIRTKNFTWNVNLNSAKNINTITKVGIQNPTWQTAVSGNLHKEGYSSSALWAFRYTGIDQKTGYPIIDLSLRQGSDPTTDPTAYLVYVGNAEPDFTGGLSNSLRYKSFTLSTNFYLQLGGKKILTPAYSSTTLPSEYENLSAELNNRWRPGDTNATFPGLPDKNVTNILVPGTTQSYFNVYKMYNYSTARVVSASTLRCNNISLSYMFPSELAQKLKLKNLSLSASVSQPFAIVSKDFKGRDAEVSTGAQPRTRSYSLNINLTL